MSCPVCKDTHWEAGDLHTCFNTLLATNQRLVREAEEDRAAIREITSFVGHEHWDSYGTRGAHCPICVRYREWRETHAAAIARAHGQSIDSVGLKD